VSLNEDRAAVSVVVPVYRSADLLDELVARIDAALADVAWELVFVNDASPDESWNAITRLSSADSRIRGINLMRNYGQHNALLAGIRAAANPIVVTIDDDLQNPPEEIPRLLESLNAGGDDLVYGTPVARGHSSFRNAGTWLAKRALRPVIGAEAASKVSAFRAFRLDLRNAFADFAGSYVSIDVLLSWGATGIASVPVQHDPRASGASGYSFTRLATHALNVLTGFSTRPLRFASVLGFVSMLFGVALFIFIVARYLTEGDPVPGFPFLASMVAIFSGVQLLTLGIIGEYLARMHVRIMDRPAYVIRSTVGEPPDPR
jgi:undecaprenyl-phosphate 4-deoxy-4-formamido-L-arabinose transferase